MHNQPLSRFDATAQEVLSDGHDAAPRFRLLFALVWVPLVAIGVRLIHVQCVIADTYVSRWDQSDVSEEKIPARDGRILSADGVVLADIRPRYELEVHYRWIEQPANPAWLRREALSQLPRSARRNSAQVAEAEAEVLKSREQLWNDLAHLFRESNTDLEFRRNRIQQRVERMVAAVGARRERERAAQTVRSLDLTHGVQGIWRMLVAELTTRPVRDDEPVVLREEVIGHVIATDMSSTLAATVQSHPHRFRGASIRISESRLYPEQSLAGHIIGIRRPDEEHEAAVGQSGVELAYNRVLTGRSGTRYLVRDRQETVIEQRELAPAIDGRDVVLTIDSRLQRAAEQLLDRAMQGITATLTNDEPGDGDAAIVPPQGGAIVALDIWTGDVLAAASAPRVSQQVLLAPSVAEWELVQADPRRPLFNRVTQAAVAPGSAFKLLTSVALLENRTFAPDEPFFCQGYLSEPDRNRCYIFRRFGTGHGQVMLADALAQSCNVYFFEAARRMGPTPLVIWGKRFGFGEPTGIDLPGEASGHLPDPFNRQQRDQWHPGLPLQIAIGQGTVTATPLQIVRLVAAIANGGALVSPRVVRAHALDPTASALTGTIAELETLPSAPGTIHKISGLHPETLAAIREGMQLAVTHPQGTGRLAFEVEIKCAGKTGTAETGGDLGDHAWFAGYAPVDKPRVAFVIFLEHGGSGGRVAAPLAHDLLIELAQLGFIPLD